MKEKFVAAELARFEEDHNPFRVAVSSNFDGGDYAYGSHTDRREYADTTVGWATDRATAEVLLAVAYDSAEVNNLIYGENRDYWVKKLRRRVEDRLRKGTPQDIAAVAQLLNMELKVVG